MTYTVLLRFSVPYKWLALTPETGEAVTARCSGFALFKMGDLKDFCFSLAFQAMQGAER